MSNRDDGFPIADVSTVLLDDAKMRKLARRCPDDAALSSAIVVYMATLLASWREGRRLAAADAESWIEPNEQRTSDLRDVGLFDAQNRIPAAAWERHFKPAWERREAARASGRKGAARRWGTDSDPIATDSDPIGSGKGTDGVSMPDRPTVLPTVLPTGRPRANGKAIGDEVPFVMLSKEEQAAALQREGEELTAKIGFRVGVKVE